MPMSTTALGRLHLFALLCLFGFCLTLALAACQSASSQGPKVGDGLTGVDSDFKETDGKLKVATTVAPLTSIVLNVGGDHIHIHQLIPDGVDSHTFEPKPSDAQVLARASLLIMNGAHLEGPTEKIAESNLKDKSKIYKLADNTLQGDDEKTGYLYDFSFPKDQGAPNPHLWMNPQYAATYAKLVQKWLAENDAANKDYYQGNLDRYLAVLSRLDQAIDQAQATVPAEQRKLLTYHDSWAYWARRYGWTVIGAIQPSDFKEPSAKEVADLINQVKQERVKAIFGSEVFPSKVLEQIGREAGAQYIDTLRDDEPPGKVADKNHTYVGMLLDDMRTMFRALGGNADALKDIDPANSFQRS